MSLVTTRATIKHRSCVFSVAHNGKPKTVCFLFLLLGRDHMLQKSFQCASAHLIHNNIDQFLSLQSKVLKGLDDDRAHYISEKNMSDVISHLDKGMPIIGLFHDDKLIGTTMLTYPDGVAGDAIEGYPIDDFSKTTIVGSLYIDADYKGIGLSKQLFKLASEFSRQSRPSLLARIAVDNSPSRKAFEKRDFTEFAYGTHPVKGHDVVYVAANANDVFEKIKQKEMLEKVALSTGSGLASDGNQLTI